MTTTRITFASVEDLLAAEDTELGTSDWFRIDQLRIGIFAELTQDRQWIHVDPERAAAGPFGTTVAHGYLTLSLIPRLNRDVFLVEGYSMALNYGLESVRFVSPLPVDSDIRTRVTLQSVQPRPDGSARSVFSTTVEVRGSDRPACVATTISLFRF